MKGVFYFFYFLLFTGVCFSQEDWDFDNKKNTDLSVIKEIDDIINIVNLSRSARNKANIKVRQPLSNLYIYSTDNISDTIKRNEIQIKEELNIKEISC